MNAIIILFIVGALLLAASLAGCDLLGGAEPPAQGPLRLPEATCTQVETTLADLQTKVMIEVGAAGEATIEQAAWQAMGRQGCPRANALCSRPEVAARARPLLRRRILHPQAFVDPPQGDDFSRSTACPKVSFIRR